MANKDEILKHLEEFNSHVEENPTIPEILENFLVKVAKTGETLFPWEKLKALVIHKTDQAMKNFESAIAMDTFQTYPNVENATFEQLRERILASLKSFSGAPFTIQRIAELITDPRKHYKRTDKFLRGIEKNVNIVTTVDPFGFRLISDMLVVNGTDSGAQDTPDKNTSLFVPPAPMNSPVTSSTAAEASPERVSPLLSGEASSTSLFKALTSTQAAATSVAQPTQSSGSLFSAVKEQEQISQNDSEVSSLKSEEAESTATSGSHGSSSQSDLCAALQSDKVTVCVDTNEDEDVDVTNSDDDKMDASQEECGMKREATAVTDNQEPPVKKQKQDDQEVATSSLDVKRRESGGFETTTLEEGDVQPCVSSDSEGEAGTATQHSDVSSSVCQSADGKNQATSTTASQKESASSASKENETTEKETETTSEVEACSKGNESEVTTVTQSESGEGEIETKEATNETVASPCENEVSMGVQTDEGTKENENEAMSAELVAEGKPESNSELKESENDAPVSVGSGDNVTTQQITNTVRIEKKEVEESCTEEKSGKNSEVCEPDSAGETGTEIKESEHEEMKTEMKAEASEKEAEVVSETTEEPMDTD